MKLPAQMDAIDPAEAGGPEVLVLARRPVPAPGPGEVLIQVAAAGSIVPTCCNGAASMRRRPARRPFRASKWPGRSSRQGRRPALRSATRVCALIAGGGYAEYALAPAGQCLVVPDGLSMVEAAALPETLFTVWSNLFERGFARDGETALIHGGTSGIGTMAIALCGLFDIKAIVTCGSDDKCRRAEELGAAHAINYATGDFVAEVNRLTGGRGADIVLDMVGGDYLPRNLDCLAEDGRHVSIAVQRGVKAEINIGRIMQRRLTLTGSTLRPRPVAFKTLLRDEIAREVWPLVAEGRLGR